MPNNSVNTVTIRLVSPYLTVRMTKPLVLCNILGYMRYLRVYDFDSKLQQFHLKLLYITEKATLQFKLALSICALSQPIKHLNVNLKSFPLQINSSFKYDVETTR